MFPYIITFALSLVCFYYSRTAKNGTYFFLIFLGILFPSLLAGFRDLYIGSDTDGYVIGAFYNATHHVNSWGAFYRLVLKDSDLEILYLTYNWLIAHISGDIHVYLFFAHILMISTIVYSFKKTNTDLVSGMYMFFTLFYGTTLNAARQSIALGLCLISFSFLYRKCKMWKVLLFLILAIGFHNSALVFLLVLILYYFVRKYPEKFDSNTFKITFIIVVLLLLYTYSETLLYLVRNWDVDEKYYYRYGGSERYGTNTPISLIALTVFNLVIFFICKRLQKGKNQVMDTFSEYVVIASCIFCFLALISTYAVRLNGYLIWLSPIIIIYYLSHVANKKLVVTTYTFYMFYWYMCIVVANLSKTYPYRSAILGI